MNDIIISDEAYSYDGGPLLLLAGPGTGKTYQLAKRIQHLVTTKGALPDEITVITFTSEAAKGMRTKLQEKGSNEYIEAEKRPERIMTMHALGHLILTENLELAGLIKDFVVVEDMGIKKALIRDAAIILGLSEKEAGDALRDRTCANRNLCKNSRLVIDKYEDILRASNAVDYDDQITLACKLLRTHEQVRHKYVKFTKYLLVDEYQDINDGQFELISLLSQDNRPGLFVVGDDDQSIYSFRGGSPVFIRSFKSRFGEKSVVIQMRTSRRCPEHVLECASSIVSQFDATRVPKGNYTYAKADKGKVVLHDCPSDDREAHIICAIIKDSIQKADEEKTGGEKHFILIPNRNYAGKVQETLNKFNIVFDSRFEERNTALSDFLEIKQWVDKKESSFSLRLVIELLVESGVLGIPSSRVRDLGKMKARIQGLSQVANLWENVIAERKHLWEVLVKTSPGNVLLENIVSKLSEIADLYAKGKLPEFLQTVTTYATPWSSLEMFFKDIKYLLRPRSAIAFSPHAVRILTLQSSKGLQAHNVYIIGLEEDILPRSGTDNETLPEEARLLFVGMTRAEKQLHLFKSRKRTSATTYRPIPHNLSPSRFLEYLPAERHTKQFHPAQGTVSAAKKRR